MYLKYVLDVCELVFNSRLKTILGIMIKAKLL